MISTDIVSHGPSVIAEFLVCWHYDIHGECSIIT